MTRESWRATICALKGSRFFSSRRGFAAFVWTIFLLPNTDIWAQDVPSVTVEPGPDRRLPERGAGFASIQGLVLDQDGKPVAGASVVAVSKAAKLPAAMTTVEGIFRFRDLPPGQYELRVECEGYSAVSLPAF